MSAPPTTPPTTAAVPVDRLRAALGAGFRAVGVGDVEADRIVDAIVDAEVNGVPTHGLLRSLNDLRAFRDGKLNARAQVRVVHRRGPAVLVDGDRTVGYLPTWVALQEAMALATGSGVGVAGVRNIGHFGRAAYYVDAAARAGLVAVVCQNTAPLVAPPGARTATHGNNPLAFSAPGDDAPLFDAAVAPRSAGELVRRTRTGESIPAEWGYVDEDGAPVTDPAVALRLPMPAAGGAKGFGVAVLIDLLAGILPGARSGPDVPFGTGGAGAFVLVLDPDVFGAADGIDAALTRSADAVRDAGGHWPGDRARAARREATASGSVGVPVPILEEARHLLDRLSPGHGL